MRQPQLFDLGSSRRLAGLRNPTGRVRRVATDVR